MRSYSSRSRPFEGMQTAFSPRARADLQPARIGAIGDHDGDLGVDGPAAMLSAMASKFDPRPEMQDAEPFHR